MTFCLNMHVEFKGSELTWQNRIGIILQSVRFFYVLLTHPGRPFVKSAYKKIKRAYKKITFLFLSQNICCGYSKEPSQSDVSFEHTKHKFTLLD